MRNNAAKYSKNLPKVLFNRDISQADV